ncbi:hypothetical protein L3X38_022448 [Prunus dulcis]|uniref:Uncharacterized protein n=1 Tax=Prunus dulcis TaxID=3755 RepID=A0AAD4Z4L3_PRUDU|nr:hypothetical protein L3X38_022448 [Prunus dulcis]
MRIVLLITRGNEAGLGWNSSKGTVDASDELWNNKIQINAEYAKSHKKGFNPEMEEKLDRMFMNTTATGEHLTIQMVKRRRLTYLYVLVHEQLNYII